MKYIPNLKNYKNEKSCVVTIGKFDGLHTGHQLLINEVRRLAKEEQLCSVVCAMEFSVFWEEKNRKPELLMTSTERIKKLQGKVDYLVEAVFDHEFMELSGFEFICKYIQEILHAKYVVVGEDFRFGYKKAGDILLLQKLEKKYGYKTIVIPKKTYGNKDISSSYIKELIKEGKIEKANELLGYQYSYEGRVRKGNQIGRTIGFPTLNLYPEKFKIIPRKGVYYTEVMLEHKCFQSLTNIGKKPTIEQEGDIVIESYLFDYQGNAYGKEISVALQSFRRKEQKFVSIEEMKIQIENDRQGAKSYFSKMTLQ